MPKTHPTYDAPFRQGAIDLLLSSGRPLKRVAADLGVSANALQAADLGGGIGKGRDATALRLHRLGRRAAPFADPAAEIRRLQRENESLRRQREILKKARSILSEDPTSSMR